MKKVSILVLCSLILSLSQSLRASPITVDAIIIMDSSGSMKKTDPKSLRKPAAKLFLSLLGEGDRASVMSFSDNGYPITYLNALDNEKNRQLTLNATDKASNKGIYTNIHAAIERAYKIISEDRSDRQPMIILLSDGKMDVGDEEKSYALGKQLLEETTPKLIEAGIKVYSIAFTDQSDKALLTEMSDKTGGFCKVAENDQQLHLAFTSIFEQSKEPEMLPLTENTFLADESIQEITIVASKAGTDSKIFLETPDKKRIDASVTDKNIKWFISDTFDMITLKKPQAGEWKILFSDNNNKAYIVADMSMKSEFDFLKDGEIEKLQARAWLEKDDAIVTETKLLDSIHAELELSSPSEQNVKIPMGQILNDEAMAGKFLASHTPEETGLYFATITLKSQTFERQKTFSFHAAGVPEKPVEPEKPPVADKPEKPEKQTTDTHEEPEDENDMIRSVLIFIVLNIVIAIIGLLVFLIIKLKKAKQAEASD